MDVSNSNYNYEKERKEAIDAGNRALFSLNEAKRELDGARNWGIVDIFGGGFFTNVMKHSKMDNAQNLINRAKYDLQCFSKELQDVSQYININVDTFDFLSFADFFFDGIIADWLMQDRINNARQQLDDAINRVQYALAVL